ncbi:MAG: L,D-transpeptidase [Anderseniella sp.]|jgi:lipoprotein-anchoring transpeptidase ErfK/SrfK|nr:L,D-transpeptidase [Anderseniella sp.]
MSRMIGRRKFLGLGGAAALVAAAAAPARAQQFSIDAIDDWLRRNGGYSLKPIRRQDATGSVSPANADPYGNRPNQQPLPPSQAHEPQLPPQAAAPRPPLESPIDFPIERVPDHKIKPQFRRQLVQYNGPQWPGTIVVDTRNRHLYLVRDGGQALRFGVGVGRDGFRWQGEAYIGRKARWPRWTPPAEMVARDPTAAPWANGMPGGPDNPLGARALYLFDMTGKDTLYRIHGTNDPSSIGKAMSSGCIRMLNQDIDELHRRVLVGARVVVLNHGT